MEANQIPPFHIDRWTGQLSLPDVPLILHSRLRLPEFLESAAGRLAKDAGANNHWHRYTIRTVTPGGVVVWITLFFFGDSLKQVTFGYGPKDDMDWTHWSPATEKARAEQMQGALIEQLGHTGHFAWGDINAQVDAKDQTAGIYLRFSN